VGGSEALFKGITALKYHRHREKAIEMGSSRMRLKVNNY
jgi:hypothetical protein